MAMKKKSVPERDAPPPRAETPPAPPAIDELELADIFDAPAIQSMMDAFFALEKIGMAIIDLRGRVLVATGWQDICTKFHRVHPEACKHCVESDVALSAGVAPGEFKLYRCKNGLWDMATPIVVGGRHVGNFFLGQFFFDDEQPDLDVFRAQARQYGFDEADYLAALDRVPRWSREKVDRAMTFYAALAQQISALGYRNLQLGQALADQKRTEKALQESEEHYRLLAGNAQEAVYVVRDGKVVYANAMFASLAEMDAADVLGVSTEEFVAPEDRAGIRDHHRRIVAGEPVDGPFEIRVRSRKGAERWVAVNAARILWQGQPATLNFAADITARKHTEERLRLHAQLLDGVRESVVASDLEGRILYWGRGAEKLYGYKAEEVLGRPYRNFAGASEPPDEEAFRKEILAQGSWQGEHRQKNRGGETFWTSTFISLFMDEQGRPAGYIGIDQNITDRKQAERTLRESEERFRQVAETAEEWIWEMDAAGVYTYSNPVVAQILGYAPEELVGRRNFIDLIAPSVREDVRKSAAKRSSRKEAFLKRVNPVLHKDGHVVFLETTGVPILDPDGHLAGYRGADTDVTERQRAEAALQGSETRYRTFINATSDLVFLKDEAFRYLISNRANSAFLGQSEEDVTGRTDFDLMPRETAERCRTSDQEALRQGTGFVSEEAAGGRAYQIVKFPVPLPGGRVGVGGFIRDVTDHKQAEEALRKSESQLSNALEMAHAGHWEYDVAGDMFTFNDNFYRIFRTTAEKVGGYRMPSAEYARRFCHPDDMALVARETQAAIETTDPHYSRQIEHRILRADGSVGHIAVRFFIVKDPQGRTVKTYGVNQDITDRKRTEEQLRDSERRFKLLFESMSSGFALHEIILDGAGTPCDYRFLQVNPAFEALTGLKADALIGRTVREVLPRTESVWIERYGQVALAGEPVTFENYSAELGRHYQVTAYRPQPGQFAVLVGDITARKQVEEALRESEQRHRDYLAYSPHGIFVADETGRLVQVNPAACRITGYSETELLAMTVSDLHGEDGRKDAERHFQAVLREGKATGELKYRTKSGEPRWWLVSAVKISDVRFLGFCNDITARKQAEEKLQASAERFRDIAANIPGAIYQLQTGRTGSLEVSYMSSGCEALFGRPLVGMDFTGLLFDHMHVGDRELFRHSLSKAAQHLERWSLEFRVATPEGTTKWLRGSANPRTLPNGAAMWNGVLLDITGLKQAEESLREREAFQALLMDTIPSPVFYKDRQGRYLGFNKAFETLYGITREQLVGKSVFDIAPPELAKIYHAKDLELLQHPGTQIYEAPMQDAQGGLHDVIFHKASIIDAQGAVAGLIGILLDVTERKRAEAEILNLSKFPQENPHPVLRIAQPGTLLYSNSAGRALLAKWNVDVGGSVPEPWLGRIQKALESAEPGVQEEEAGGRIFSVSISPVAKSGYVNLYALDISERKAAERQMARQLDELRRWQTVTLGREGRVAELKREVNALAVRLGQPPPYSSAEGK